MEAICLDRLLLNYPDGYKILISKYSAPKDVAVNAEIAAFNWGAVDELKDITLIAGTLVKEVSDIDKQ